MTADETRARFLAAIAQRVPAEKVEEVHVFAPMKQGGLESGVAVVAVAGNGEPGSVSGEPGNETGETDESGPRTRLTVYTATYRLTLKGPERGKWEFAMNAEADAPLVTVDAVVRGVQRRSGDIDDPEKLSGEEFRELVVTPDSPGP